ncbi:hypothetical protein M758_12G104400 [Ceratodon purpureus]|nr:hypothetical protein M758_12G104400 [Ceratodon purpureus]
MKAATLLARMVLPRSTMQCTSFVTQRRHLRLRLYLYTVYSTLSTKMHIGKLGWEGRKEMKSVGR